MGQWRAAPAPAPLQALGQPRLALPRPVGGAAPLPDVALHLYCDYPWTGGSRRPPEGSTRPLTRPSAQAPRRAYPAADEPLSAGPPIGRRSVGRPVRGRNTALEPPRWTAAADLWGNGVGGGGGGGAGRRRRRGRRRGGGEQEHQQGGGPKHPKANAAPGGTGGPAVWRNVEPGKPVGVSACRRVTVSRCDDTAVSRCDRVTMSWCLGVTMSRCHSVTMSQRHGVSALSQDCRFP
eukprot:gene15865-biopygen4133